MAIRLTRQHYTVLAELIGDIECGHVDADNIREEIAGRFEFDSQPAFKPEKFYRHADEQVKIRNGEALPGHLR